MLRHHSVEDLYTLTRKLPACVTHSFAPLTQRHHSCVNNHLGIVTEDTQDFELESSV